MMSEAKVLVGDVRKGLATIADGTVQTCITSPPYWGLRDYGHEGQIGLEQTPQQYVDQMVDVFREVRRVLADDGTVWLNLGDSYCGTGNKGEHKDPKYADGRNAQAVAINNKIDGLKSKDLVGIPWRVAFALQDDGWYLRQDIIWHKPNPLPESVTDRCTKAHEYLFLLTKQPRYYFDNEAIRERGVMTASDSAGSQQKDTRETHGLGGGNSGLNKAKAKLAAELAENGFSTRNKRSVWTIQTKPFKGAHFAVMPDSLVEPCVSAGSKPGDLVLDPFTGSGTVGMVACGLGRRFVGCELNPEYAEIARDRIGPLLTEVVAVEGAD